MKNALTEKRNKTRNYAPPHIKYTNGYYESSKKVSFICSLVGCLLLFFVSCFSRNKAIYSGEKSIDNSIQILEVILDKSHYPDYIDTEKVSKTFGFISIKIEYGKNIETIGRVIDAIVFYRNDKDIKEEIGRITRNGITNIRDSVTIFPYGFNLSSSFVRNHFMGFSSDVLYRPFFIKGIAYNKPIGYYKAELLIQVDIDFDNEKLKLYTFDGEP